MTRSRRPPDDLLPTALALAERIAALSPVHELTSLGSDDIIEAIAAFREERSGNDAGS